MIQRLRSALWSWQYRTRMAITRPFRIALMRRKMHRRKGSLIPAPQTSVRPDSLRGSGICGRHIQTLNSTICGHE